MDGLGNGKGVVCGTGEKGISRKTGKGFRWGMEGKEVSDYREGDMGEKNLIYWGKGCSGKGKKGEVGCERDRGRRI